ncbi:MAG: hypothetical protein LBU32_07490 [Clostridiales bacterium]|nr:hypothetical protein [Clostridiales bacterium]
MVSEKFKVQLTQDEFDAIEEKNEETLYYITDSGKVYLGNETYEENSCVSSCFEEEELEEDGSNYEVAEANDSSLWGSSDLDNFGWNSSDRNLDESEDLVWDSKEKSKPSGIVNPEKAGTDNPVLEAVEQASSESAKDKEEDSTLKDTLTSILHMIVSLIVKSLIPHIQSLLSKSQADDKKDEAN